MTKREAVKGLDRLKTVIWKESNMQIALDMAIEALDQVCENDCDTCKHCEETDGMNCYECVKGMRDNYEPTAEYSSDVISREEVKKQTTKKNSIWITITDSSGRGLDEILDSIPPAQPERKTDGDIISRQAAIDALLSHFVPQTYTGKQVEQAKKLAEGIMSKVPSAQPFTEEQIQTMQELESAQIEKAYELGKADRPTGHWIEDEKQNVLMRKFIEKGEVWRVCSVCGAGLMIGAEYETDKYYHETFHNFCPNCGADMRGGPTLTPEEFAEKMAGIAENGDEERKHVAADSIMCELLKSLGFGEGVGIFEDMDKWYS